MSDDTDMPSHIVAERPAPQPNSDIRMIPSVASSDIQPQNTTNALPPTTSASRLPSIQPSECGSVGGSSSGGCFAGVGT
eukprot:452305-Prymnesium_polylepis.1